MSSENRERPSDERRADDWPDDDPLLDACLEEVLGARTPPDLTARILESLERRRAAANGEPSPPPRPAARPIPVANGPTSSSRRSRNGRRVRKWLGRAIAVCVLLAAGLAGVVAVRHAADPAKRGGNEIAQSSSRGPQSVIGNPQSPSSRRDPATGLSPAIDSSLQNAQGNSNSQFSTSRGDPATSLSPAIDPLVSSAESSSNPQSAIRNPHSDYASTPAPQSDAAILAFVEQSLRQAWVQNGVRPSPPATDGEWARRAYLRLIGRTPTYEELTAFLENRSSTKKAELVNQLLFDDEYGEQYARHWSGVWTNLLIGRTGGMGEDDLADRQGLEQYLRRSFQFNKRYDQMAFELISASGVNRPGAEDYNGAVNFVLGNYTSDFALVTSKTARVFLGKQLHCAQCHNHPFESWTQDDYWGLNAFFRQAQATREGDAVRLVNRDFPGETGDAAQAEIYYDRLNGVRKVAYPKWLDGTAVDRSGEVAKVDRRRELANFLSDSRDLSRAMVNRLWSHFLGYGFVEPTDDMRPSNPPSHPEVLEHLADQFIAHNYDVKRLMRWIVLSEPFALSSRITPHNLADAPDQGVPPLYSRYYTRQMRAEEVYESLALLAADGRRDSPVFAELQQARPAWLAQFTQDLETDEGDESNTFNGAIPQSLAMMNGELVQRTIDSQQGFLHRIAAGDGKPAEKLRALFLAAVAREPTRREIEAANQLVVAHRGDVRAALEDLWWALLNSNEFILDH